MKTRQHFKVDLQIVATAIHFDYTLISADDGVIKACERTGTKHLNAYAMPTPPTPPPAEPTLFTDQE